MKKRVLRLLKPMAILAAVGFLYTILHWTVGLNIPCPIYTVTGLYCPGCGVTRMIWHLMRWEWWEAMSSNVVIFCLLPAAVLGTAYHLYRYIRYGEIGLSKTENIVVWAVVALLLIFSVIRNIVPIDILVP